MLFSFFVEPFLQFHIMSHDRYKRLRAETTQTKGHDFVHDSFPSLFRHLQKWVNILCKQGLLMLELQDAMVALMREDCSCQTKSSKLFVPKEQHTCSCKDFFVVQHRMLRNNAAYASYSRGWLVGSPRLRPVLMDKVG